VFAFFVLCLRVRSRSTLVDKLLGIHASSLIHKIGLGRGMLSWTNGQAYFDHLRRKKVWNDDDDDGANLKLVRRLMGHL